MKRLALAVALGALFTSTSFAQSTESTVQRDVNQQQRIEDGLKNGALTTREASQLERQEAKVSRDQARALKDGTLTTAEKARLTREQNQVSRNIARDAHNAATGSPNSASSLRMQADVQRNINQQTRIEQGVKSGALTNKEASQLEAREAHVAHVEARAGRDGNVNAYEQHRIQTADNRTSRRIFGQKHDTQHR